MIARASGKMTAVAVRGESAPEAVMNQVLAARGFDQVRQLDTLADVAEEIRTNTPTMVFVPIPSGGDVSELNLVAAELRRHPEVMAIGTAATKDADVVLAAMRAGITEFLLSPADASDLGAAVSRMLRNHAKSDDKGQLVVVYSAKGGVGSSTVAASLAWALAQRGGSARVALVDFTISGAGVRVLLDLRPRYDLANVATRTATLDHEFIRSCLVSHDEGVCILAAPEEIDAADPLTMPTATRVLELLCDDFDYVVVDADHHFTEQTLAALDAADRVVLLSQANVLALRSTQRALSVFSRLGYSADRVSLVLNRWSDKEMVSQEDAEKVLGRPVDARIPRDGQACSEALLYGQFVQEAAPTSPFAAGLRKVAALVAGEAAEAETEEPEARPLSRLGRLFSRK